MDIGVISVRYARALLKSAEEAKLEAQVYAEMQTLADSYLRVPELRFTIDNPMLAKDKKESLLIAASGEAIAGKSAPRKVTELTKRFIRLVLQEGRENALQFMANSYITLYRQQKNIIRGRLITAAAVSAATEQKLRQMVESKTQRNCGVPDRGQPRHHRRLHPRIWNLSHGCECEKQAEVDTHRIKEVVVLLLSK